MILSGKANLALRFFMLIQLLHCMTRVNYCNDCIKQKMGADFFIDKKRLCYWARIG